MTTRQNVCYKETQWEAGRHKQERAQETMEGTRTGEIPTQDALRHTHRISLRHTRGLPAEVGGNQYMLGQSFGYQIDEPVADSRQVLWRCRSPQSRCWACMHMHMAVGRWAGALSSFAALTAVMTWTARWTAAAAAAAVARAAQVGSRCAQATS